MKYMQNRYYWTQAKKIDGTYRILCLGDSVLLGQGVTYFETLSYKLEEFLNCKIYDKEIEVVNLGTSGFSIYDEWVEYLRKGDKLEADMVIITLAAHDVELFVSPRNSRDNDFLNEDNIINLQYFELILSDISNYSKKNNLPIVIAFYDFFVPPNVKRKAFSTIKNLTDEYNIDCINISNAIDKDFLFSDNEDFHISTVDHHPTAYATEQAANRLGEYILNNGSLNNEELHIKEDIFYKNLIINAETTRQLGNKPEMVLYRLKKLFSDKHKAYENSRLSNGSLINKDEMFYLKEEIQNILPDNIRLLFIEAYAEILKRDTIRINSLLNHADLLITRFLKNIFVQEKNLENENLKYFPYKKINQKNMNLKILNSLLSKSMDWKNGFDESNAIFLRSITSSYNEFDGFVRDFNIRRDLACKTICSFWDNAISIIDDFSDTLSSFDLLVKKYNPKFNTEEPGKTFLGLMEDIITVFESIESLVEVINLKKIASLRNFDVVDKPVCNCVINFRSDASKGQLRLQLNSLVPHYSTIIQSHWLIGDGEFHSYQFEVPLFTLGKIQLIIFGQGDLDFEDMKIYINENRQITLKKENFTKVADNIYDSGLIFNTI